MRGTFMFEKINEDDWLFLHGAWALMLYLQYILKVFNYVYLFKLWLVFRVYISSSESKLDAEP
jgi:hypothetical protein